MSHILYRVHDEHKASKIIGTQMVDQVDPATGQTRQVEQDRIVREGSIHHPEMEEFRGVVTRSHDDGTHDIMIFPPNRPPLHVDRVSVGDGPHQIRPAPEINFGRKKQAVRG